MEGAERIYHGKLTNNLDTMSVPPNRCLPHTSAAPPPTQPPATFLMGTYPKFTRLFTIHLVLWTSSLRKEDIGISLADTILK
jgi:hypothetical protein